MIETCMFSPFPVFAGFRRKVSDSTSICQINIGINHCKFYMASRGLSQFVDGEPEFMAHFVAHDPEQCEKEYGGAYSSQRRRGL